MERRIKLKLAFGVSQLNTATGSLIVDLWEEGWEPVSGKVVVEFHNGLKAQGIETDLDWDSTQLPPL
ncbi:MAG: hypothetical protein AAB784_01600 [Patescibacteria group bacterium]